MAGQAISDLGKLGEGGMGVVYKARDTDLDSFVALKREKVATSGTSALIRPEGQGRFCY